jgi:arylsulfatase A-like enzyme
VGELASRPNVLLLVAEDLSPRLGAYGDAVAHTPNLDRLAEEGVRFERAFATAGVCAPSRAGIILGVPQNRFGAGHMRAPQGGYVAVPPPDWKAFPELLRAAGYWTANSGKTDYQLSTRLGGAWGGPFTIWDRDGGLGEGFVSDDLALWAGRAPGQPFFAYLTLGGTHESQIWPTWQLGERAFHWLLLPMRVRNHARWEHRTDPARVAVPPYYPDTPVVRADLARHYDNIAAMDALVGETLAALERDGLAGSTLVVFTSDHGDGLPRAKRWLYDSGIRVPLVVRWPGHLAAGTVSEELVSLLDLAPTFLSLAGAPVPAQLEGRVLVGPARAPAPEVVFAARDRMDESSDTVRAARDARFAYVRNLHPELPYQLPNAFGAELPSWRELARLHAEGALTEAQALWFREQRPPEELYDTAADPHQLHDLAADPRHAADLVRLRAALDAWLARAPDLGLLPEAELRERFWPGGEQPTTAAPEIAFGAGAVSLRSATAGASLGYRVDGGAWRLYTGPFALAPGARVEAKAVRYGWRESEGVEAEASSQ